MKITLGSTNAVKREALEETIKAYDFLADAVIETKSVKSNVSEQPKTLEETITGSANRAKAAYADCDYSIGIESGFMEAPHTKTGYMELTICAVYDGNKTALGFSPAFECPPAVMQSILAGQDLDQACVDAGLTTNSRVGKAEGAIGILTKGKLTRKDYTKQAIMMALIQLENPSLY